MKLREYLNEMMQGKQMDKLVSTLMRAKAGQISQQGMIGLGFNLRSPAENNESKLAQTMSERLNLKMTEQDLRQALKEVGLKSASQVVQAWNKTKTAGAQTRVASKRLEKTANKRF